MSRPAVTIELLDGAGPVQGEGTIGTKRFYFRARNHYWTFAVADAGLDPADIQLPWQGFLVSDTYGAAGGFEASYMARSAAEGIIRRCAELYLDLRAHSPSPTPPGF